MNTPSIVVLKLGSSVLPGPAAFATVVQEIYRHVRQGQKVVAVVSAVEGQTNRMLADAEAVSAEPAPHLLAEFAGFGERQSTLLLALALERAGVPAVHLSPAELGLIALGAPLDADPAALDTTRLRAALEAHAVAVVPGFVAQDQAGRPVLLGRGGSDLTALFIADALGRAECRLIKDVDGIYERDPAVPGVAPRRYREITWADALAVAGKLVQAKAVVFAESRALSFEVAALGAAGGTRVGPGPTRLMPQLHPRRPLKVALFGAGTVGYGVYRHLASQPERFEVVGVAVRDVANPRPEDLPRELLTDDPWELLARPADVVIELLGGEEPALEIIARALESGRDVITANKPIVAEHGALLEEIAVRHGRRIAWSASVGGSLPAVELARQAAARGGVQAIDGVLNGTCNFILDRLAAGNSFDAALAEAQARGFAEADPTQDISGGDAAAKLRILARAAFGAELHARQVRTTGIDGLDAVAVHAAAQAGTATRLVASCALEGSALAADVAPRLAPAGDPLAAVHAEWNLLRIRFEDGAEMVARGKGAGRWPTAEAVFADVLDVWRGDWHQTAVWCQSPPPKPLAHLAATGT